MATLRLGFLAVDAATRRALGLSLVAAACFMAGCGKQEAPTAQPAAATPANVAAPLPDVGTLANVVTEATGFGHSAGEAVTEAMKLAILQVNGAAISSATVTARYGLDVALNEESASLRADEFAHVVAQRSGGVIQNFKLLALDEPTLVGGKRYKATIEARIARFTPSADMNKIKVVVGPIRFDAARLPMGDKSVSSAEVGATLRQRIGAALVQTGRFAVLDRQMNPEIERELSMITSGQAPSAELAKLSQAASADVIWSASVSRLEYNRHARRLKTSDRELVHYSGGWALSEKLVDVATRQVMASATFQGQAPATRPTTLGRGVDGGRILQDMSNDLVGQVVTSILRQTFPVTVVSLDGTNVVLSQGGQAVRPGARYAMVAMGAEMKDPQTGQSLGRVETPCCELVIDRVTPNLSYGRLENVKADLAQLPVGGLQLRDEVDVAMSATSKPLAAPPSTSSPRSAAAPATARAVAAPRARPSPAPAAHGPASRDDDKW